MGDVRKCIAEVVEQKGRIEWLHAQATEHDTALKAAAAANQLATGTAQQAMQIVGEIAADRFPAVLPARPLPAPAYG